MRWRRVGYIGLAVVVPGAALVYGLMPASASTAGPIKGLAGKCVDVAGAATANSTPVDIYDCNGTSAQIWTVGNSDKTIQALGKCLGVVSGSTVNGAKADIYDCNGSTAQTWTATNGELVNGASGKCLDATGQSSTNGNQLQIWSCTGASNQLWTLPGGTTSPTTPPTTKPTSAPPSTGVNLDNAAKKEVAMELVSAAENSSLNWKAQYSYIEDIGDGRGYTAGIIGFCSGTGDMLELVEAYTATKPSNVLAKYLPALRSVNGTDSHTGLDPNFTKDWKTASADTVFQAAQDAERDRVYFNPSVADGKTDGVRALGQFIYYDASVMHGYDGMRAIRTRALKKAKPPAQGGNETTWLNAFLDERVIEMQKEEAHSDTSRVDTEQRVFLNNGNLDLNTPLTFAVYGDPYTIK
jgi:chitosanase